MFPRPYSIFLTLLSILFFLGCISPPPIEPPPIPCMENWSCNAWSACTNGTQTRSCADENFCGTDVNKPIALQSCEMPPISVCGDFVCDADENEVTCPFDCKIIEPEPLDVPLEVKLGNVQTVFDYEEESCAQMDLPDVYAHAFRDAQNNIVLVSGNAPDNYFMFGSTFNTLSRSCSPVLKSGDAWDVEAFDHQEWITSTYTEDGKKIHALVHNEYHDPFSSICKPGDTQPSNLCWYNFVSYARSTDGGKKFTQPASPNHLVAIPPFQWDANSGGVNRNGTPMRPAPQGYMEPSNIVKGEDGYYYAMVRMLPNPKGGKDTVCVMRTQDLDNPASWKFWDGDAYSIPLTNPYPVEPSNPNDYICEPVSYNEIGGLHGSLTYNTYVERYMNVGAGVYADDFGELTCGFWYSLSEDLITWGKPHLLYETILGFGDCPQTAYQKSLSIDQEAYPSLIDHDSDDRSFTTADDTLYLYYMQNQDNHTAGGWGLRRNLVRVPVTLTKVN